MVFGFLTRRRDSVPQAVEESVNAVAGPSTDTQQAQLRTPSPSIHDTDNSPSRDPPVTPSPPPEAPLEKKLDDLRNLVESIPAKILHTYTLSRLESTDQLSADTLIQVTSFFSELVPPPKLHCVRCHKSYFDVENTDRSCLVAHDDESAEVERVASNSTTFETLWGCCGRTTEGDGNMGPPDGWCYEGKHTTDLKRARFRADSSIYDDKLISCERKRCNAPPRSARTTRKRARALADEDSDDEDEKQSNASNPTSLSESPQSNKGRRATKKPRTSRKSIATAEEAGVPSTSANADAMDVDSEPAAAVLPSSPKPKSRARPKPTSPKAKALSTPKTSSPLVKSIALESSPEPTSESQKPTPKPKSTVTKALKPKSSKASLKSAMQPNSGKASGPTPLKEVVVELPARSHSRTRSIAAKEQSDSDTPSKPKPKPRARSKAKTKSLGEVVDSSILAERS